MVRAALLVAVLVAGCGAHRASSPAWPKMTERASDGGESLAPHASATSVAAVSDGAGDDDIKVVVTPAAATPAAAATATPATAPTVTAPDDPLSVEEITIEISDD